MILFKIAKKKKLPMGKENGLTKNSFFIEKILVTKTKIISLLKHLLVEIILWKTENKIILKSFPFQFLLFCVQCEQFPSTLLLSDGKLKTPDFFFQVKYCFTSLLKYWKLKHNLFLAFLPTIYNSIMSLF